MNNHELFIYVYLGVEGEQLPNTFLSTINHKIKQHNSLIKVKVSKAFKKDC